MDRINLSTIPKTIEDAFAVSHLAAGQLRHHGRVVVTVLNTPKPRIPLGL